MHDFFSTARPTTLARDAMIATSHPLATAAGLEMLAAGGHAVDAAIAAVAVQSVVDPLMTGMGGDCFAILAPRDGAPVALNGSGRAPAAASVAALKAAGLEGEIPQTSPHAVTVPGAVSAWCRLHGDYGLLPLARVFARAISYAEDGFPVTPRVAQDWAGAAKLIGADPHAAAVFLPGGVAPVAGQRMSQPLLGARLREIAQKGAAGFYEGETGASMAAHLRSLGGLHTEADFAEATAGAEYVAPISASYRGREVFECPPNGQGLAALLILRILEGFDLGPDVSLADRIHLHAEATKLAYHHRDALLGDPASCPGLTETLLSEEVVSALRARIDMSRAGAPALWDEPEHRDTIYLCVVDGQGNALSFINSIFHGFGSTRLDPGTGVLFHSRGASFRLEEGHPNAIGPRKRPMHTIIPGLLRVAGAVMPFGVMGGHYQAAGHAAFLSGVIDLGMDLQPAMDAPRHFAFGGVLEVEPGVPEEVRAELAARGHEIRIASAPIGGSQAIFADAAAGSLRGGSDPRKDGSALGF
ncbi:gamma-glutamyltransferase family protein (plasmid) [Paroceanicella profunda]|uniref:Gamma-glutamyltransferase family protein n=1 Tax=Paroceanicella profunda TaxID=2579971 RepID=A0A5B8G1V9_9RHOB|nr:gamma-glutamyltransferase family protein [Paroceanicella profunda]QDL94034.1 gamma-glutamyltransferase family protein [Paroceanicella profunda]